MENEGYKRLAKYYDLIYQNKNYELETDFILNLLNENNCKSILDVGCGTGTHISLLEKNGFDCVGIDLNKEMLHIARMKVIGELFEFDMINFNLNRKFDAIICMFAAFNHILDFDDARKTLYCFKNHLNSEGIILIDLHNPQKSGFKEDVFGNVKRFIEWNFDKENKIEVSNVKFIVPEGVIEDKHTMRIYSIEDMKNLLYEVGFSEINFYGNYKEAGTNESKNIEVFAKLL